MAGESSPDRGDHWDTAYDRGAATVSWYQPTPTVSLGLVDELAVPVDAAVVDVGGGASTLVDHLLARGHTDVTVLDVSARALAAARSRIGASAAVAWVHADLLSWRPERRYDLWHDRAVFHFVVDPADRARYRATLLAVLAPGGAVVLATFAADGPEFCSGLPVARYSPGELADAIGDDFDVVATRRDEHHTPQGVVQPFSWIAARRRDGRSGR